MINKKSTNRNKSILSLFSGQESILTIPKIYVQLTGSHTTALVLNQCIFFSGISKRIDGEFYKTYDDWLDECCLTKKQVLGSIEKLKNAGFVITKIKRANGAPTVHYIVNEDAVTNAIHDFLLDNSDSDKREHKDNNNTENHENTCTNLALVLPKVTMDSDKRCLSIVTKGNYPYTDELKEDLEICVCGENPPLTKPHTHTIASPLTPLTSNPECQEIFNFKFSEYEVSIDELADACIKYYSPSIVSILTFKTWIRREKIENFPKKGKTKPKLQQTFSDNELDIAGQYRQAKKDNLIETWYPKLEKREQARLIYEKVYPHVA